MENGFREAVEDLRLLSPEGDHDLIFEFNIITAYLEIGQPVETALQDFAHRAQMEDITNFADVFAACKRTGGDLVEVVRRASSVIGEKLEIQQEIGVMIAQKRFESRVMFAAPFFVCTVYDHDCGRLHDAVIQRDRYDFVYLLPIGAWWLSRVDQPHYED